MHDVSKIIFVIFSSGLFFLTFASCRTRRPEANQVQTANAVASDRPCQPYAYSFMGGDGATIEYDILQRRDLSSAETFLKDGQIPKALDVLYATVFRRDLAFQVPLDSSNRELTHALAHKLLKSIDLALITEYFSSDQLTNAKNYVESEFAKIKIAESAMGADKIHQLLRVISISIYHPKHTEMWQYYLRVLSTQSQFLSRDQLGIFKDMTLSLIPFFLQAPTASEVDFIKQLVPDYQPLCLKSDWEPDEIYAVPFVQNSFFVSRENRSEVWQFQFKQKDISFESVLEKSKEWVPFFKQPGYIVSYAPPSSNFPYAVISFELASPGSRHKYVLRDRQGTNYSLVNGDFHSKFFLGLGGDPLPSRPDVFIRNLVGKANPEVVAKIISTTFGSDQKSEDPVVFPQAGNVIGLKAVENHSVVMVTEGISVLWATIGIYRPRFESNEWKWEPVGSDMVPEYFTPRSKASLSDHMIFSYQNGVLDGATICVSDLKKYVQSLKKGNAKPTEDFCSWRIPTSIKSGDFVEMDLSPDRMFLAVRLKNGTVHVWKKNTKLDQFQPFLVWDVQLSQEQINPGDRTSVLRFIPFQWIEQNTLMLIQDSEVHLFGLQR